ncbi:hypothetical protein, partial [Streptomyces sp. UH6]|uniref:hypothetical protein n=1 Tax=Streptomyces sp. UH6 TaxID=2748379 RepID=UPI0015D47DDA
MGYRYETVADLDATVEDAAGLAARGLTWLVAEGIVRDGPGHPPGERWYRAVGPADREPSGELEIVPLRAVFDGGPLRDPSYAVCPHCAGHLMLNGIGRDPEQAAWELVEEAIDTWHDTGRAPLACRLCGLDADLPAWGWEGDYFAFACLGFTFRDWPRLDGGFVEEFARVLGGHRVTVVAGRY